MTVKTQKNIAVSGARGFIGRNLVTMLEQRDDVTILEITREQSWDSVCERLASAHLIFHVAGVNRPLDPIEFKEGNTELTTKITQFLSGINKKTPIVLTSSTQVQQDNSYGQSKLGAETAVAQYAKETDVPCYIYRLPNVFGKGAKPNYNSAIATFCYNILHDLPVRIDNPDSLIRCVWVGDIVKNFLNHVSDLDQDSPKGSVFFPKVEPEYTITVGQLHETLLQFLNLQKTFSIPNFSDRFTKVLHSTFCSYFDADKLAQKVLLRTDNRGWLFELIRSQTAGQIFISSTKPGITRGNHFHTRKVEKFCVIQGEAVISLRHIETSKVHSYPVSGASIEIVDIPPGYTHNIINCGNSELLTIFWSNEPFDLKDSDTFAKAVQ